MNDWIQQPRLKWHEPSEWQASMGNIVYRPEKGKEPNWFHRKMQEFCFGIVWEKIDG